MRLVRGVAAVCVLVTGALLSQASVRAQGQGPDGPCAWEQERYADCRNGTVTDVATGLIWLQQADCLMDVPVERAVAAAASLGEGGCGLLDGSSPGDWRLPTWGEWLATIVPSLTLGCRAALGGLLPSMTDRPWAECFQELEEEPDEGAAFAAVFSPIYLAGSREGGPPTVATVFFPGEGDYNFIGRFGQGFALRVWPVRGALR
jgi:hypothetical protein